MPPVTHEPTTEASSSGSHHWLIIPLKTGRVDEESIVSFFDVDANRFPCRVEVDLVDRHVPGEGVSQVEVLVAVWLSVALGQVVGTEIAFDSI